MKPNKIIMNSIKVIPVVLLVALSGILLKGDVWTFWTWYLLAAVLGFLGMSVTGRMFRRFDDKGWVFSKVLSIAVTGFVTWLLVTAGHPSFYYGYLYWCNSSLWCAGSYFL